MKILQIAHDYSLTGAGIAAAQLHTGLLKMGLDSRMAVYRKAMGDPCEALPEKHFITRNLDRVAEALNRRLNTESLTNVSSLMWSLPESDILNFHSISMRWFNLHKLNRLVQRYALVMTMHDMSYGTAVCHYTSYFGDCTRWTTGCGSCPLVSANPRSVADVSKWIFRRKRRLFLNARVTVVTPSRWMHEFASKTPMLNGLRIEYIPNGIDTDLFKPLGQEHCRVALGLPVKKRLLAFVASNPGNPRKGFQHLPPLFERLKDMTDVGLLVVGDLKPEKAREIEQHFPVYYLGVVRDPRLMRLVYNASDMFLLPSQADNLPNTMLESLACGTPVVAFDVGGIPDGVKNGRTGVTAALGDYDRLAQGIRQLLTATEDAARRLRDTCRTFALENFALGLQAMRYHALYKSLAEPVQRPSLSH
jgi:glycosyltransferase involved in cell wall biosynthesis